MQINGITLYHTQYHGYLVSKCGQVYSTKSNKFLLLRLKKNGYLQVALYVDSSYTHKSIHRLVMETFYGKERREQINHIDGDKTNNSTENLEWCSASYNISHSWAIGHRSNKQRRKQIINLENGVFYDGLQEAANSLDIGMSYLSHMLTGKANNWTKLSYA